MERGLARSRDLAQELIAAGCVRVNGAVITKASRRVGAQDVIAADSGRQYVSRAGLKLAGALDELPVVVAGRDALDVGASTGGFTEVLLDRGAHRVISLDVGHGQLSRSLSDDPRVTVMEGCNARFLRAGDLAFRPDFVVADVSFISLTQVLPALAEVAAPDTDFVVLVKPQFEVGRQRLGTGGVVRDPHDRAGAIRRVADAAALLGLGVAAALPSGLPGASGNVEFVLWLKASAPALDPAMPDRVAGVTR